MNEKREIKEILIPSERAHTLLYLSPVAHVHSFCLLWQKKIMKEVFFTNTRNFAVLLTLSCKCTYRKTELNLLKQ